MDSLTARIVFWLKFGELIASLGENALVAARSAPRLLRPRRMGYRTRRPGEHSPFWNECRALLKEELRPRGAKVRLARYLGIPKQRVTDFVTGRRRMPDAELTLQILFWLTHKKSGVDRSI